MQWTQNYNELSNQYNSWFSTAQNQFKEFVDSKTFQKSQEVASKYSSIFKNSADVYKSTYIFWLVCLAISIFILPASIFLLDLSYFSGAHNFLGIINFEPLYKIIPDGVDKTLYILGSRLFIAGLFSYVIVICNRNYSNNRHMYNLLLHKSQSLDTYIPFMETIPLDNTVRSEVSMKIAQAIFEPIDTGYIKQVDSPSLVDTMINTIKR